MSDCNLQAIKLSNKLHGKGEKLKNVTFCFCLRQMQLSLLQLCLTINVDFSAIVVTLSISENNYYTTDIIVFQEFV